MWVWRRMENIIWTEKVRNEDVLTRVGESRKLTDTIKSRKKRWIGHILRHDGLVKDVFEGRLEGKRSRGRKRVMMLDDIKEGRTYFSIKRDAEDREFWRSRA